MTSNEFSRLDRQQIEDELSTTFDELIAGCEALDLERAFSIFADTPDFLMMGTDGSLCDHRTYLKNNIDYMMTCTSFKLTTFRREIRIISREVAILSWAYRAEAGLKTGERDIIENAGASFVFRKVAGEWKVVYYHESSVPPVRVPEES